MHTTLEHNSAYVSQFGSADAFKRIDGRPILWALYNLYTYIYCSQQGINKPEPSPLPPLLSALLERSVKKSKSLINYWWREIIFRELSLTIFSLEKAKSPFFMNNNGSVEWINWECCSHAQAPHPGLRYTDKKRKKGLGSCHTGPMRPLYHTNIATEGEDTGFCNKTSAVQDLLNKANDLVLPHLPPPPLIYIRPN